jgi:hypothetical protein
MPSLYFSEAEIKFWGRIQECFDADARAKGIDPLRHIVVIDLEDAERTFLTTDGNALAIEQAQSFGKKMGEAASRHVDEIFMRLVDAH